jgi:hypothetical protein
MKLVLLAAALLALAYIAPGFMARAEAASNAPFAVVCSVERPVVGRQEAVGAEVFADAGAGASLQYLWQARAGELMSSPPRREARDRQVTWTPAGAAPGTYRLTVRVTGAAGSSGGCALDVVVAEAARSASGAGAGGLGSEAERDLLVRGSQEAEGYGLYSYILLGSILLGSRPDDSNSERFAAVLQSYLALEQIRLETFFQTNELNATYVPVDKAPADVLSVPWLLDHYDYSRSRFLLKRLQILDGDGPYIVSALHPLGGEDKPETHKEASYIFQNLSTVPVSVIPLWMKQFRSQTSQQRVWQNRSIGDLALNLRTILAVASEGLPMVRQAVSEWIAIKNAP